MAVGGRCFLKPSPFYEFFTEGHHTRFCMTLKQTPFKNFLRKIGWNVDSNAFSEFYSLQKKLNSFGYSANRFHDFTAFFIGNCCNNICWFCKPAKDWVPIRLGRVSRSEIVKHRGSLSPRRKTFVFNPKVISFREFYKCLSLLKLFPNLNHQKGSFSYITQHYLKKDRDFFSALLSFTYGSCRHKE